MGTSLLKLLALLFIMNIEVKALRLGALGCTDEEGNTYQIGKVLLSSWLFLSVYKVKWYTEITSQTD